MANKRMFSLSVVDTDKFLEMPISSRLLYYELGMRADDDGFVDNWKKILMFTGLKEDDMKVLITKQFIIPFESGIIVIRHWRMNNYLRSDRYKQTKYQEEYKKLSVDDNDIYRLDTNGIPNGYQMDTQVRLELDKNSIVKEEIYKEEKSEAGGKSSTSTHTPDDKKHKYGEYKNVLLKDTELEKLKNDFKNYKELIKFLDEYIEMKGYKAKSHYLAIRKWVVDAVKEQDRKKGIEPEWLDKKVEEVGLTDEQQQIIDRIREAHRKQETNEN